MSGILEVGDITRGGGDQRGGGEQSDAGHGQQQGAGRALAGHGGKLALKLGNARFEQADFFEQEGAGVADQIRHSRTRIGQHASQGFDTGAGALGNGDTELAAKAAQGIDAGGAGAHPQ